MIDELLNYGIKEETLEEIKDIDSLAYDLECNIKDCKEIIIYLLSIGINSVDEVLLYKPGLFLDTKKEVEDLFNKKNISELVKLINDNVENIELIFE